MTHLMNRAKAELQLTANGENAKSAKVKLVARTGDPIEHWYWGRLVHDFAGMEVASRIPLDYAHDPLDSIGFLNHFDTSSGDLICSGAIVPHADDKGAEVVAKAGEGVPYEASIEWDMDATYEYIGEGVTVFINPNAEHPQGRPVEGPATIARKWKLIATAICKFGADPNTSTELQLARKQAISQQRFFIKIGNNQMSTEPEVKPVQPAPAETPAPFEEVKTEPAALDKAVEVAEEVKSVEAPTVEAKPEPVIEPTLKAAAVEATDPRAEARKFIDAFGESQGVKYFAEGLQFDAALLSHMKHQQEQIAALQKRIQSSDRGASEPIKFSDESKAQKPGKLADVIQINNRKKVKN